MARPEPDLADLTTRADRLLEETENQLAAEEATQKARVTYERFQTRRDDALYHGTLFTGMDLEANLQATAAAATEALALYGLSDQSTKTPILPPSSLNAVERDEIKTGCYELLLLLADAEATPLPGRDRADHEARARRALGVLERAAGIGILTRSYHARRAKYLEQKGDREGALEETKHANTIQPTIAVDFFLLGEQLYKSGAWHDASRSFERALRLRPDYFWAQYFLAACDLKADPARPAEAKAHLTAALSRRPAFAWIYLLRAYACGELGEFAEAEADFARAIELRPDQDVRYGVLVNRGAMRFRQGNHDAAVADLVEAAREKPRQDQAHANLALTFAAQKQWNKAIEQLNVAIELAPYRGSLYRNRALMNLDRKAPDAAFRDFGEAIRLAEGPTRARAGDHIHRGRILHSRKNWTEAMDEYNAALELDPDNREVHRLRADALVALGRGVEAIQAFNRVLEPKDVDANAFRQRGFEQRRSADFAGAIADFSRALDLDPGSPFTRARRGWGFLNEANKLALHDFEEALKVEPKNGDLLSGRGLARAMIGNVSDAVADAEESLRSGIPGNELRARLALNYNAACIYAQAAARAAFTGDEDAGRQILTRRYQDRAVELIRQALELLPTAARAGFITQAEADSTLDPIRHIRRS